MKGGWRGRATATTVIVVLLAGVYLVAYLAQPSAWAAVGNGVVRPVSSAPSDRPATTTMPAGSWSLVAVELRPLSRFGEFVERAAGGSLVLLEPRGSGTFDAAASMDDAKEQASIAARASASAPVDIHSALRVVRVAPGSPAHRAGLRAGDRIVSVDGRRIAGRYQEQTTEPSFNPNAASTGSSPVQFVSLAEVRAALVSGAEVHLVLVRLGAEREVVVATTQDAAGVDLEPDTYLDPPQRLDADTGPVEGRSAGLMLALAFVDELSPGDLTAGLAVAGTGSIAATGTVGAVDHVEAKAAAAVEAGAALFFVPPGARPSTYGSMEVVEVATLDDAIAVLCGRGASDVVCRDM